MVATWLNTAFASVDGAVFGFYHNMAVWGGSFFTPFMEVISYFGKSGIFSVILAVILTLFKKTRKMGLTALVAVGIGALITNVILKPVVARPRPYTFSPYNEWWQFVGANGESDLSFPSGHVTAFTTCLFAIFLTSKHKKITWLLFIPIALMGASRNYLIVHYFSDVLFAYIVAGVATTAAYFAVIGVYKLVYKYEKTKFCTFWLSADIIDLFRRKEMRIAILIANGSEEMETFIPVDVLRRASVTVDIISVSEREVICSHGVKVTADKVIEEVDFNGYDAIVIPGGMPGATNIASCEKAVSAIKNMLDKNKLVSAICASPAVVLANNGLLNADKATCFPAEDFISALGEKYTGTNVEKSQNVITANGPKSAFDFALAICDYLKLTPKI